MAFERFVRREELPYEYVIAGSVSEARAALASDRFDAALVDYVLGDGTAFDLFDDLGALPFIVVTGSGNEEVAVEVMKAGTLDYVIKDAEGHYLGTIPTTIENAISRRRAEEELRRYRERLEDMVAERTADLKAANDELRREIAERRQVEEALRESEARARMQLDELELLYKTTPAGLCLMDTDLRFVHINERLAAINGRPVSEHIGKTLSEVIPEIAEQVGPVYRRVIETGEPALDMEVHGTTPAEPGVFRDWLVSYFPYRSAEGTILGVSTVVQDITARKQAEAALKQSEERYQGLFENAPIAVWEEDFSRVKTYLDQLSNIGGRDIDAYLKQHPEVVRHCRERVGVIDMNRAARTLHQVPDDHDLFESLGPRLTASSYAAFAREVAAVRRGRTQVESEVEVRVADGSQRHVVLHWAVAQGHEQTYDRVLVSLVDITKRKQYETYLRAQRKQYQELVQSTSAILWRGDPKTFRFTFVSREAETLLGYARERWTEEPEFWLEHVHPEDREWVPAYCAQATAELRPHTFDYRMIAADGRVVWLRDIVNVLSVGGQAVESVGVMIDITEQKQAEEQLLLQSSALEAAANGILITGTDGTICWVNQAFVDLTGYAREEAVGQNPRLLKSGRQDQAYYEDLWKTILAGEVWRGELINRRKDGSEYIEEHTITPVRGASGKITHFVAVQQDVTARKEAEDALKIWALQQEAVSTLGQEALTNIDLDVLFEHAVSEVARTLQIEYCKVLQLLPDGQTLLLRAGVGWKKGLVGQATVDTRDDSQAGHTLLSNEPVVVDDLRTETRFIGPPLLTEHEVVSGMSVIIGEKESPFGILGAHTTRHRVFTKDNVDYLQSVANVLAAAIKRRQAEQALMESETRMRTILDTAVNAIITIDEQGHIESCNPAAEAMFGYEAAELIGASLERLMPEAYRSAHEEGLKHYLETGEKRIIGGHVEVEGLRKDGTVFPLDLALSEVRLGERVLFTGIAHDITERKQA
ncbi:MAG: PAS domain S-box protein, partial [Rhodothermales bacterium]